MEFEDVWVRFSGACANTIMKYQSGEMVCVGDRVKYNGQEGLVALVAGESRLGSPLIKRGEWALKVGEALILFLIRAGD